MTLKDLLVYYFIRLSATYFQRYLIADSVDMSLASLQLYSICEVSELHDQLASLYRKIA